jgi:DNA-3-methyladenine glycosylase I
MKNLKPHYEVMRDSNKEVDCTINDNCGYDLVIASNKETIERLLIEIDQVGLRWETVLKNQDKFKSAFCELDFDKMIAFKDTDHERLFMITALLATV